MQNKPPPTLPGRWESQPMPLNAASMSYFANHGRGQKPRRSEWRLVCISAGDQDLVPGDELRVGELCVGGSFLTTGHNGAQCWVTANFAAGSLAFMAKHTGVGFNPTIARWNIKCIAEW